MTSKQELKSSSIRSLYLDLEIINELMNIGTQGKLLYKMLDYHDVAEAVRYIDTLAHNELMYPDIPFAALSYCDLSEIKCVIVGGMPSAEGLKDWTGSAFSYFSEEAIRYNQNDLHEKIVRDLLVSEGQSGKTAADNVHLQEDGVLLLHNAMSATKEHPELCKTLWRPIISRILQYVVKENRQVPIIFVTGSDMVTYKSSVCGADNIFCLRGCTGTGFPYFPKIFKFVEDIMNKDKRPHERISFVELITKFK